ncbi:MAG: hypothetical protein AB9834_09300 [Lentimicrobium sp.]
MTTCKEYLMKDVLMKTFTLTSQKYSFYLFLIFAASFIANDSFAQGSGLNPTQVMNVSEVVVQWDSIIPTVEVQKTLTPKLLKTVSIFPNSNVSAFDLDVAQARVLSLPDVQKAKWNVELLSGNDVKLILFVRIAEKLKDGVTKTGIIGTGKRKDFPILYMDEKSFLKFNLAGNFTPTLIKNTWWGNGKTFTEFNPYGKNPPGVEAALDFESYLIAGLAGATRISKGKIPIFAYGVVNVLGVTTLGDELYNANSNTFELQVEEAYAGIVAAKSTASGNLIRFMVSFGKQPYRIGNGMLICQIAGNGGVWGGMNAWPRFAGKYVGLAKFAYDRWRFEGFYIQPNEYEFNTSDTKLAGVNAEFSQSSGFSGGFTYLNVFASKFPYFYPDLSQTTREGLNAMNLRMQWIPKPNESFIYVKAEGGLQFNGKIPMRAYGMAFEGGWQFGDLTMRPTLSYRYSLLTGDDPETDRFERWDILYSGDDVTTWVQGPLMKNVLFNSNLETSRFQLQLFPKGWRITSQYSFFLANQLNTIPSPALQTFTDEQIGQEISLIVERFVSRNIYVRFMATSLWAGTGIVEKLPNPVTKPWTELIAMVKFSF